MSPGVPDGQAVVLDVAQLQALLAKTFNVGLDVGRGKEPVALVRLRLAKALIGVAEANALAAESIAIERGIGTEEIAQSEALALHAAAFNGMPDPVFHLTARAMGPVAFNQRHRIDVLVGIYLIVDRHGRLVYLGQARRDGGVLARLDGHAVDSAKRDAFQRVWVVALHDRTDQATVSAIEGRMANDLGVRGRLSTGRGRRRWPSGAQWVELVAGATAEARAADAAD
jgi:hypothetical protein